MKKMLKITAVLLALTMLFALAACGADEPEGLRIAIVTSGSSVDDGSFNQDNYNGILDFTKDNPDAEATAVGGGDIADSLNDVESVLADYDVLVLPGFQFAAVSRLASENPDKFFILVDTDPEEYEGQTEFDNIYAMTFKEQESGFFAGIAAAMETQTGMVAFVGGQPFPPVVNYQFGFEAGVRYANDNLGADARIIALPQYAGTDVTGADVGGNYVQSFGDQVTGKAIGEALIAAGCDIIFVAAGDSGNGVFTAAKETEGVFVIGCDVDQYDDGVVGDRNIVLTSVLKNMRVNVTRVLNAINDDTFSGGNYLLGADTDSTGYVSASGRQQLSGDTLAALETAYAAVRSGEIVPPGNFAPGNISR